MDHSIYDLLIVTDATASMGMYLTSLRESLPEIIRISALTGCFSRIGIVAYRDYCGGAVTEWSGWHGLDDSAALDSADEKAKGTKTATRQQLLDFAKRLTPSHGGDWPEAAKTGLALGYDNMREDVGTVVVFYTDAPPHTPATAGTNRIHEQTALTRKADKNLYGAEAPQFADWVTLTDTLCSGRKQARVYSIVQSHLVDTLAPYTYLSTRTGGACFEIHNNCGAAVISKITLGILLTWMGVEKETTAANNSTACIAKYCRYRDLANIAKLTGEADDATEAYWVRKDIPTVTKLVSDNFEKVDVHDLGQFRQFVATRKPAMTDFSKRYLADEGYRALVIANLQDILRTDVAAVTVNPVFGSLWRTVCSDRLNEARDELITLFGQQVDAVTDPAKKQRLKAWLEESYDYAGEILEMVAAVPAGDQFPCVFLDPTLDFSQVVSGGGTTPTPAVAVGNGADGDDEADNTAAAIATTSLTRADLLEIGRSCDARILRRLGRVLTRLTYVETEADLPKHIADKTAQPGELGFVPRIPLALARREHKRKFWKVLLHTIVPGTMLGPRPAALLAALSLRMGMARLRDAADRELIAFQDKWNTLDIPETWNTNCLNLLLSADLDYEARVRASTTARSIPDDSDNGGSGDTKPAAAILGDDDRALFKALVDYKLAEINLGTTLTARVGWQPDKTKVAMGPTTTCRVCHFPRSVTVMAADDVCGLCVDGACGCATPEIHDAMAAANVAATDGAETPLWWVECSVRACRAQYVVYNPDKLCVRPKCHYCRTTGRQADDIETPTTAPYVECTTCLSRIIWPTEYRPKDGFSDTDYTCPACNAGVKTVVDIATSAKELAAENGRSWLLRNDGGKIAEPFTNRSLFHTVSTAGVDGFAASVEILPGDAAANKDDKHAPLALTLKAKTVRNPDAVVAELRGWIVSRRAEGEACSLCFSQFSKRSLRAACGRKGCDQRICDDCYTGWYGLNARGKILNVAALSCPFCRRQPAPAVVATVGLNMLGNLRLAVEQAGTWIYAWCNDCGMAKEFAERVCARGAPPEVERWRCAECEEQNAADDAKKRLKPCPRCETMTEKMGGCDHISCPVPSCGAHWCFFCGKEVAYHAIYDHMSAEHGGWFAGGDDDDDYDDEDGEGSGDEEYGQ